jgi:uncharacterized OsmC-like protein
MSMRAVAEALARLERVSRRRPETGLSADVTAKARWNGPDSPLRVVCRHPTGVQVCTDMPAELAGSGDQVTPGWLHRAGLASCATTSIVMLAAIEGVALTALEVDAESRSDAGGLVGRLAGDGRPVSPAPVDQRLVVRLTAAGSTPEQLRSLVQRALLRSPIPAAVMAAGLEVQVDVA